MKKELRQAGQLCRWREKLVGGSARKTCPGWDPQTGTETTGSVGRKLGYGGGSEP